MSEHRPAAAILHPRVTEAPRHHPALNHTEYMQRYTIHTHTFILFNHWEYTDFSTNCTRDCIKPKVDTRNMLHAQRNSRTTLELTKPHSEGSRRRTQWDMKAGGKRRSCNSCSSSAVATARTLPHRDVYMRMQSTTASARCNRPASVSAAVTTRARAA